MVESWAGSGFIMRAGSLAGSRILVLHASLGQIKKNYFFKVDVQLTDMHRDAWNLAISPSEASWRTRTPPVAARCG